MSIATIFNVWNIKNRAAKCGSARISINLQDRNALYPEQDISDRRDT